MFSPVFDPLSKRSDNPPHRRTRAALAWSSNMTAVTPETVSEQTAEPRLGTVAHRLASLLVRIRTAAGEDLQATIARAIDDAFAGIHREMR